ncbi:MAG: hypothetical protein GF355_16965 [Candidatus Eisenbacteria bacterium]|nr:hypothetical protein [Candidatus Eisenbacteria bacterium]
MHTSIRKAGAARGRTPGWGAMAACAVLLAVLLPACTKFVEKKPDEIEVQEKVRIIFNDGDRLVGRLGLDEWVDVTIDSVLYRGRIVDLNDEQIMIGDAMTVSLLGDNEYEMSRMADARLKPRGETTSHVLERSEIKDVHLLTFDAPKTFRRIGFWSWMGVAGLLLMVEHSG